MSDDVLVVNNESRCEIMGIIYSIKKYMKDNSTAKKNKLAWYVNFFITIANVLALIVIILNYYKRVNSIVHVVLWGLVLFWLILYKVACNKLVCCDFEEIKREFGNYGLFVFLVTEDSSLKQIKVSKNRKEIKLIRKYKNIKIRNDAFEIQGVGNNVYLINIDERCIYAD